MEHVTDNMKNEIYKFTLAGLLHDVGKFYNFHINNNHIVNSIQFIDNVLNKNSSLRRDESFIKFIKTVVYKHHDKDRLDEYEAVRILKTADRDSATERGEKDYRDYTEKVKRIGTPLRYILDKITPIDSNEEETLYFRTTSLSDVIKEFRNRLQDSSLSDGKLFSELLITNVKDELETKKYYETKNEEFENICSKVCAYSRDISNLIDNLSLVLMNYLAFIPSDVLFEEGLYVSLYHHLKLVSAVAPVIHVSKKYFNSEECTIIAIEIGSIQKFISKAFNLEESRKKATKRIRGRSFFVSLISEILSIYLLEKLGLTQANKILCSGGKVIILSYKLTDEMKRKIEEEIEKFILENFFGDLSITIAFIDTDHKRLFLSYEKEQNKNLKNYLSDSDSEKTFELDKSFKGLLEEIERELSIKKARQFRLKEVSNILVNSKKLAIKDFCISCGNPLDNNNLSPEEKKCSLCYSLEELGEKSVKSEYILLLSVRERNSRTSNTYEKLLEFKIGDKIFTLYAIEKSKIEERGLRENNIRYSFIRFIELPELFENIDRYKALIEYTTLIPLFEFSYVPTIVLKEGSMQKETIMPIESVIEEIEGINLDQISGQRLSILEEVPIKELNNNKISFNKICLCYFDLDNAGKLLSQEEFISQIIEKENESNLDKISWRRYVFRDVTISKYLTLSFSISFFFNVIGYFLAKKHNVYVIFSGGDDVKAFGSPYEMLEFIVEFSEEFKKYFRNKLTYSGSVILADSKTPILSLITHLDELETEAKKYGKVQISNQSEGVMQYVLKGFVAFLNKYYIISYHYISKLREVKNGLIDEYINKKTISISSLYKIYDIASNFIGTSTNLSTMVKKLYLTLARIEYILKRNYGGDYVEFLDKFLRKDLYVFNNKYTKTITLFIITFSFVYLIFKHI